jgi:predicted nucleic acid-binding protein
VKAFLDTNILVYGQQPGARGDTARELVADGGTISVQILNELANVLKPEAQARLERGRCRAR